MRANARVSVSRNRWYKTAVFAALACAAAGAMICVAAEGTDEFVVRPNVSYTADQLEGVIDPFEPAVKKEEPLLTTQELIEQGDFVPPELTIQAIIWGGPFPQAIVNDRIVRVGDVISEAMVVDIHSDGIVFSYKNKQFGVASPGTGGGTTVAGKPSQGRRSKGGSR